MLYAVLKSIHLLALIAWIGGMFFTLFCLRPSLTVLEGPMRLRLMHEVLRRFFGVVSVAALLVLVSGVWMIAGDARAAGRAGVGLNMPIDWYVMAVLGMLMVAIFAVVRFVFFRQLSRTVEAQAWPEAARVLGSISRAVQINLALGVIIIVVTRAGTAL